MPSVKDLSKQIIDIISEINDYGEELNYLVTAIDACFKKIKNCSNEDAASYYNAISLFNRVYSEKYNRK
jgi:hypothetical protein